MSHHEESPEKPQYNMGTPPISRQSPSFCLTSPFQAKIFRLPPPNSINFEKVEPPFYERGGGFEQCLVYGYAFCNE